MVKRTIHNRQPSLSNPQVWRRKAVILPGIIALVAFLAFLFTLHNPDQKRLQFYLSRTMTPDISYCHGQTMDFYAPRKKLSSPGPVVLYIHGGGWLINHKQSDPDHLARLDPLFDEGYAFASINYRSLPVHRFPAPVEDALCAVRFLKENEKRFNIDGNRIVVYGNSAGAHIAAMVGVLGYGDKLKTTEYPNRSSSVRGILTIGGQMDFTQHVTRANRLRTAWFAGGYDDLKPYPAAHVNRYTPPFMLVHGTEDKNVRYQQAELMAKALEKQKIPYQLLLVQYADHGLHPEGGVPQPTPDEINKRMQQFVRLRSQ